MTPPLLTFYGDDFTGSSAVMEVLSFAGIETMLFLDVPDANILLQYPNLKAVGVAGIARTKSDAWMRNNLPPAFEGLKKLGAPLFHYKVCSTFDSAPDTGSIGVAAEVGMEVFDPEWIPLVVGAPAIGRYQVFGNLFAAAGDEIYRLDRHPVMSRHPVTPMDEADLGQHLCRQTSLTTGCIDYLTMRTGGLETALERAIHDGKSIVALDAMDDMTLEAAGRFIDLKRPGFAIGSQGIEYALVAYWRASGQIPSDTPSETLKPVDQLFAVSGSCAPTTATQIEQAEAAGFAILALDASKVTDQAALNIETDRVRSAVLTLLSESRDVLVTTARGPDDPAVQSMNAAIAESGIDPENANANLGKALGRLVAEIRCKTGLPRIAIGGGDTSGHVLTSLQADALSAVAPLAPGAPLCRVHAHQAPEIDGLEVTLKGGQMGSPNFFIQTDTVILAVPDRLIGKVLSGFVNDLNPGTAVIMLDAAAPHADTLPERDDITYFVAHPCHPPLFNDETDPDAKADYFGGIAAKQHIVCALAQGPEEHYAKCEEIARVFYGPVMRSHRVSVAQMALLEPALSESVGATFAKVLKDATDEAARRGIPYQAAEDFLLGHLTILLAVAFGVQPGGKLSDGCLKAIEEAEPVIFKDGWMNNVFSDQAVKASVKSICA